MKRVAHESIEEVHWRRLEAWELESRKAEAQELEACLTTLREDPRNPAAYTAAAKCHRQLGQFEQAIAVLQQGIAQCEPSVRLYGQYIKRLEECNRTEEAIGAAREAIRFFPDNFFMKLQEALLLPLLYDTEEEVERYRRRYEEGLCRLSRELSLETNDARKHTLAGTGRYVNVLLGYQGRNDRDAQVRYGELLHRIMAANFPQWTGTLQMPAIPRDGTIRVGYVSSRFFRGASVMKTHLGWLREHDRRQFSIHAYYVGGAEADAVTEEVRRISKNFKSFPNFSEQACQSILDDQLHILIYLDIGLSGVTAQLASLRLAAVQCATWEAAITTGLPTIDYYISSALAEPEDAEDHYSEKLVRLPGIGVCYRKPVIPTFLLTRTRADFGLRDEAVVYSCCQDIVKYLPDHDHVCAQIAARVPNAQFIFLVSNEIVRGDFRKRLGRAFSAVGLRAEDYCVLLPKCPYFSWLNLNVLSDVFLDTFGWSGGVTTFEAVACGTPVVTLPGRYMRGRQSYAILKQLGVIETIARDKAEYVEIAVRLGTNRVWRESLVQRMVGGYPRLYSDTRCVRALEDFFRRTVAERLRQQDATTG